MLDDNPQSASRAFSNFKVLIYVIFGVVLPFVALFVEVSEEMSAEIFISPIPTALHILAIALVPCGVLFSFLRLLREAEIKSWDFLFNGICIGVSIFYTLFYLKMMPVIVIGILFMGLGFLPLSPLIALICLVF